MKRKIFGISLLLAAVVAMTGCGSNDKTDAGSIPGSSNMVLSLGAYPILTQDAGATYISVYAVHAVDGNGNPQSRLPLSIELVNKMQPTGYSGAIHKTEPVTFSEQNTNFAAMGTRPGDTLIIIPVTYGAEELSYVGNWKITQVSDVLTLGQNTVYNLVDAGMLTYVVGNERSADGYIAHVQRPSDTNTTGKVSDAEKGLTYFEIVFDKTLADSGRCVWVGVHLEGSRTGTARCVYAHAPAPVDSNSSSSGGSSSCSAGSGSSCPLAK